MGYAAVFAVLILAVFLVAKARSAAVQARLMRARDAYRLDEHKLGAVSARKKCAHEYVQFGQTGTPGVATATTKWCRVCGGNLGPAKLKESLFGNRWE